MMQFRRINKAITKLLGDSAAGRFTVTGYQGQGGDATEFRGKRRNVQSYFRAGNFPPGKGRAFGSVGHDMSFTIGLTVSAPAQANLAVINQNPPAPAAAVAEALAGMRESACVADESWDELVEIVWQILMDARNSELGFPNGVVANRWVSDIKKDDPVPQGSLLVLTGEVTFTCSTSEDIAGDIPVPMTEGIEVGLAVGEGEALTGVIAGRRMIDIASITFNDGETIQFNDGQEVKFK